MSGDQDGAADHEVSTWCSNRESEVFRTQEQSTGDSEDAENLGVHVRIASGRNMSGDG